MDLPEDDVAASMGFSSFGGQPKKKRKHNHTPSSPKPPGPRNGPGSVPPTAPGHAAALTAGTHGLATTQQKKNPAAGRKNRDEINLEDDDDDDDDDEGEAAAVKVGGGGRTEGQAGGVRVVDHPSVSAAARADVWLEEDDPTGMESDDDGGDDNASQGGEGASTSRTTLVSNHHPLPARPAAPAFFAAGGGGGNHQRGGRGHNRVWWEGYYDPMSNENPWETLEQKMGLAAQGPWLPRGHGRAFAGKKVDDGSGGGVMNPTTGTGQPIQ